MVKYEDLGKNINYGIYFIRAGGTHVRALMCILIALFDNDKRNNGPCVTLLFRRYLMEGQL
jgi:hypothetical protein